MLQMPVTRLIKILINDFVCSFHISVKNPVYAATIGNEIQLERPKGSITVPSRSQDNQLYEGLVISNGKLCT